MSDQETSHDTNYERCCDGAWYRWWCGCVFYSAVVRPINDLPSGVGAEYAEKAKNLDQLDLVQEKLLQEQVTHIPIEA